MYKGQDSRQRLASDDRHYLDMLKSTEGRKDERDRVQKKTFTKWVNKHLMKHWRAEAHRSIDDLYEDLRDGHNLISLLEVLSGDSLQKERDVMKHLRLMSGGNERLSPTVRSLQPMCRDVKPSASTYRVSVQGRQVTTLKALVPQRVTPMVKLPDQPREKGRMRFHKLQNVGIALEYLKHRQVRLVNIRNDDIADGNPKLTLGLIWTIILHFQ
uniref:plectin-like n=1 Tax=Pristiophorus japonicus TaxID=55135 RepID=UPI00398EB188